MHQSKHLIYSCWMTSHLKCGTLEFKLMQSFSAAGETNTKAHALPATLQSDL